MERLPREEYKILLANWSVLHSASHAHGFASSRSSRGLSESFFSLSDAISPYWTALLKEWYATDGLPCSPPLSLFDVCALVLRHWAAPIPGRHGILQCTGLVHEMLESLQINAAISVDLMDACESVMHSRFEDACFILHARDVLQFKAVVKKVWSSDGFEEAAYFCRFEGPVPKAESSARSSLQHFKDKCLTKTKTSSSLKRLRYVIKTNGSLRVLIPLMIESAPKRGKPGIGHWVAVE
jgi:hypothetical protein